MRADGLQRVRVTGVHTPILEWVVGREVSLPSTLLASLTGTPAPSELDLRHVPPPTLDGVAAGLRLAAAYTSQGPLSMRLPFSYQRVPPNIRWWIGRHVGRRLRNRQAEWARFPDWPLDCSADFIDDWESDTAPVPGSPTPVALTHDIDSAEGLRNLVDLFLPLEEAVGARSANYIVPCGWPLDHGLLREIASRGHEIGVHGYDHSNRTPFLAAEQRRYRLTTGLSGLAAYAPQGYRAPSLVRTAALIDDLPAYYRYDSSIPTSGGPFPVFNNGCATVRPFRIGGLLEIPVTMRRDGSAQFLGYSAADIGRMWRDDLAAIAAARGVAVLLTHCEQRFSGHAAMLAVYADFLEFAGASTTFAWSTMSDIAESASTR